MKTSLVISIKLFAVFTILVQEISCEETCLKFNEICVEDSDCCSENCRITNGQVESVCLEPKNSTFITKIESGNCIYNKTLRDNNSSDHAFAVFGINAAHAVLPAHSKVQLNINNKTIDVVINSFPNENNGTLLELSKEAARELGIEENGLFPCSIYLYEPEFEYSTIKRVLGFTASFFVVMFVVMTFF